MEGVVFISFVGSFIVSYMFFSRLTRIAEALEKISNTRKI